MAGWVSSSSLGSTLTASPISSSRIRTASNISRRTDPLAADGSGLRRSPPGCRPACAVPGMSQGHQVAARPGADSGLEIAGWYQVDLAADNSLQVGLHPPQAEQPMSGGRSRSLSGRSWPRATLPNTRRLVTPCAAAAAVRAFRLRHCLSSCVCAGERAYGCSVIAWSGAGSNRRPSAFQVNTCKRCADLRIPRSLISVTALSGMWETR
jgi:hypothetical protein